MICSNDDQTDASLPAPEIGPFSLYGIIGHPVDHSLSPVMHNAAFRHWGLNGCYVPFPVRPADLPAAMAGLKALGVQGINVTVPHKETVLPYLDSLSEGARRMGAVNTVCFERGRATGHNTDGAGFIESLKQDAGTDVTGKVVFILGAGGAGRAVAYASAEAGAKELIIANRTLSRAQALGQQVRDAVGYETIRAVPLGTSLEEFVERADIVVNATSLGMKGRGKLPFPFHRLGKGHLVCDLVYVPHHTDFLQRAGEYGARTLDGLGMLIHQGDLAFRLWTGRPFPISVVRGTLESTLVPRSG